MIKNIKNKKYIKDGKFCLFIIAMLLVFTLVVKLLTMTVSTSGIPSLLVNDNEYPFCERYPLEIIRGVPYVPADLFEYIKDVKIEVSGESFYIQLRNNFISFDTKTNYAKGTFKTKTNYGGDIFNIEEFYEETYIINNVRYVRADVVAESLEIDYEFDPQYEVVRIRDRTARKSLNDLIAKFTEAPVPTTPAPIPVTTTERYVYPTPEPTTLPSVPTETTAEPTTPENTREIVNYFIFHGGGKRYTEQGEEETADTNIDEGGNADENGDESGEIDSVYENNEESQESQENINVSHDAPDIDYLLDELDRREIQSIFFFTGSEISENPTLLRKIYAMGHEIGIEIERGKINPLADDLRTELEEVNSIIYTLTKTKTRFYILDENMYESDGSTETAEIENLCVENLKKYGYCRVKETFDISESQDARNISWLYENGYVHEAVNEMINFLKQNEINIIRFNAYGGYYEIGNEYSDLNLVTEAVKNKFYITVEKINFPFFLKN